MNPWNRRKFIQQISIGGLGITLVPKIGWSQIYEPSQVNEIIKKAYSIDAHNHVDVPFNKASFSSKNDELLKHMKTSGLSAIGMTFCVDRPKLTYEGEAFERFTTALYEMDILLKDNGMQRALNITDWEKAKKQGQPIVIQAVEGGHFIEGKLDRIAIAHGRGLRHLGLLHDNQSTHPLGDIYTNPEKFGGLTALGKEVVKKANALGILVDLAHGSDKTVNDAIAISSKPIIISHTGLNTQLGNDQRMAKIMMPRLINKEEAKLVANAGGVVGVWTHLAANTDDMAKNIAALVDVMGIAHVAIGTDTKILIPEVSNDHFGNLTNHAFKTIKKGFLYDLVASLLNIGFNENEILQIIGGNYARVFKEATS
ncbi:dipeptidase [Zhouia sp. PK063]|uniref:dipeptidase n=1 Tax=Zhouia sp. PK063 TaxID=3373602 RepID=UPI0037916AC7